MSASAWLVLTVAWVAASLPVGLLIGQMIRLRDLQTPRSA